MRSTHFKTSYSGILRILQIIVFGGVILYFGRPIFVPIAFSALISFVLYPICAWLQRKGLGKLLSIIISLLLLLVLGIMVAALLVNQFISFVGEWPAFESKLTTTITDLSASFESAFGVTRQQQMGWLSQVANDSGTHIIQFLRRTVSFSAVSAVMLVLIPVYVVLILFYRHQWMMVLYRIFPSERREALRDVIFKTISTYYNFIKGMAIVYLTVGILNSIGLLIIGVPHAILFGFITSVLTFIPYIGIIVGSLLPITLAWVTYDSVWYPIAIIGVFTFVQYLEANVIFPVAVSSRLNVNTFAMLVSIFAGGLFWGVSGMILFVPFVGILKLIADHNPKMKTLSTILGTGSNSA